MPDISFLYAFWTPETGFNYQLIVCWLFVLGGSKILFPQVLEKIAAVLLKLLNKIPLLAETDLDERFFSAATKALSTKVQSLMPRARELKLEYHQKILEAAKTGNTAQIQLLTKELKGKLEELTKSVADGFFSDGETVLWQTLQDKYGDKSKAWKWVYDKVKALVEELKAPDHPSTSSLVMKHVLGAIGDLGNVRSSEGSAS